MPFSRVGSIRPPRRRRLLAVGAATAVVLTIATSRAGQSQTTTTYTYQPSPFALQDLWTSSVYSFGYNGVIDDDQLKIGGWGDVYCTYIKFSHPPPACTSAWCQPPKNPLEGLPVRGIDPKGGALLQLYVKDFGGGNPVRMNLGVPNVDWSELWAGNNGDSKHKPTSFSSTTVGRLPAPTSADAWMTIDISHIYRAWSDGTQPNTGISLCPQTIDNQFNMEHSSDFADDPSLRPRLVLTYSDPDQVDIKMPLPGGHTWRLSTEIGGRDCRADSVAFQREFKTLRPGVKRNFEACEIDPRHTDYTGPFSYICRGNTISGNARGNFFALDFAPHADGDPTLVENVPVYTPADGQVLDIATDASGDGYVVLGFGPNLDYEIRVAGLAGIPACAATRIGSCISVGGTYVSARRRAPAADRASRP
jgi:hypothetical protein